MGYLFRRQLLRVLRLRNQKKRYLAALAAALLLPGCDLRVRPHAEEPAVPQEDVPRSVLAQCPAFKTLIKACHPSEHMWWVIYDTSDPQAPQRSIGFRRVGKGWRAQIKDNRAGNYCD